MGMLRDVEMSETHLFFTVTAFDERIFRLTIF